MKYICEKYPELSFYVDGKMKQFVKGVYRTDDKKEMKVLSNIADIVAEKEKSSEKSDE